MNGGTELLQHLDELIGDLHRRALAEYQPIVEEILCSGNRDTRRIEHTLDGLLDFCGDGSMLRLYRRLCHYYFSFNPTSAVTYVTAYREMYGSDDGMEAGR